MEHNNKQSNLFEHETVESFLEGFSKLNTQLIEKLYQKGILGINPDLFGISDDANKLINWFTSLDEGADMRHCISKIFEPDENHRLTRKTDKRLLRRFPWKKADKEKVFEILGKTEMPQRPDIKSLRQREGLSQSDFARVYGLNLSSLRAWERGLEPSPITCAYLRLIDLWPNLVREMLGLSA